MRRPPPFSPGAVGDRLAVQLRSAEPPAAVVERWARRGMNARSPRKRFKRRSVSLASRYGGRTVLAIGAHPDDVELAIGGMLARFARESARVVIAVISIPPDFETRRAEARQAAGSWAASCASWSTNACCRIDDMKNYQLVGMLDALVRELQPAGCSRTARTSSTATTSPCTTRASSTQRLKPFDFFTSTRRCRPPVPVEFHPRAYVDVNDHHRDQDAAIEAHLEPVRLARPGTAEMYRDLARLTGRMVGVSTPKGSTSAGCSWREVFCSLRAGPRRMRSRTRAPGMPLLRWSGTGSRSRTRRASRSPAARTSSISAAARSAWSRPWKAGRACARSTRRRRAASATCRASPRSATSSCTASTATGTTAGAG